MVADIARQLPSRGVNRLARIFCVWSLSKHLVDAVRHSSVFFFQAEDGIRDPLVTGVQTCALPISMLAQADAGRTYAEFLIKGLGQHRSGCNCGVYDDTRNQVYAAWDHEGEYQGA